MKTLIKDNIYWIIWGAFMIILILMKLIMG